MIPTTTISTLCYETAATPKTTSATNITNIWVERATLPQMDSCQFLRLIVVVFAGPTGSCLYSNTCKVKPIRVSEISFSITCINRVYSSRTSKTRLCRTSTPTFRTMKTLTLVTRLFTYPRQTITTVPSSKTFVLKLTRGYHPFFQLTKSSGRKEITI